VLSDLGSLCHDRVDFEVQATNTSASLTSIPDFANYRPRHLIGGQLRDAAIGWMPAMDVEAKAWKFSTDQ
jgi:hypothetical protein